ncbi:MAG: Ig-like domain-containing protein, partial [Chitinophagales bacterium]|nr:Ig-like domain-containing protein [Chitinophagales bacterium]
WTSSNPSIATVTHSGVVTGVSGGKVQVFFTDANGCSKATDTIYVDPVAYVSGVSTICVGGTTTLYPTSGGTWVSSNPAVASVSMSGVVTGLSVGTATFSFTNSNGCTAGTGTVTVTAATVSWYLDADGDGWYAATVLSCGSPGMGWTTVLPPNGPGDCNDANPLINPGATEICGNGIDEDCSGADLPCGGGSIVWLGNTPDWHNPANWSTGSVPSLCAHHISIPVTPNNPVITSSVTVGNIQIADNVSVTICGTCVLNVCGNITDLPAAVNASFTGGGKVVLNGSVAHGLSGKLSFSTLQLNNLAGAGILATAQVDIHEYLELRQGNLNVAGVLNFKSPNEHHSAILDNFSPGFSGTITGNVRAERGYAAATATSLYSQHYFSSPINNVPFSQFAPLYGSDGVYVTPTANCDETQLEANSNYGNVFEYDESNVTTCNLQAWKVRSSGNAQNGKGYSVVKNGSGVLTLTGIPNLGNYSISGLDNSGWNITTLQMNNYQGGWHLLGNPYLAALDLDYSLNGGFDDNVLVLHTHGPHAGTYQPLSMSSNDVLAPFQGFFARKSLVGTSPETFNIQQANRRRTQTAFHKNGAHQMSLEVEGNGYADITYFNFDENSTNGFDPEYDGGKFRSFEGQPTIYSLIGGVWAG